MSTEQPADTCVFKVAWGAATSPGAVREHNEDSWFAQPPVFVVADGMGGHARGEVASSMVVDVFGTVDSPWLTAALVCDLVSQARERVGDLGAALPAPGSTLVGVGLSEQADVACWLFFNVGDSRAYLLRAGELDQISVDHSRAQQLKDNGFSAAASNAAHNVITKAIGAGMAGEVAADQWLLPASLGDRVVLCSDGLTTELSDQLIAATLLSTPDPQTAAETLVNAAVEAGGRDNVTVVIVDAIEVSEANTWDSVDVAQTFVPELSAEEFATADLTPAELAADLAYASSTVKEQS